MKFDLFHSVNISPTPVSCSLGDTAALSRMSDSDPLAEVIVFIKETHLSAPRRGWLTPAPRRKFLIEGDENEI